MVGGLYRSVEPRDQVEFDFCRMDCFLASWQGMEPRESIVQRNLDQIAQLPPTVWTACHSILLTWRTTWRYTWRTGLAQSYYFRLGQADRLPEWRQAWLRCCFDVIESYDSVDVWAEQCTPKSEVAYVSLSNCVMAPVQHPQPS